MGSDSVHGLRSHPPCTESLSHSPDARARLSCVRIREPPVLDEIRGGSVEIPTDKRSERLVAIARTAIEACRFQERP
jgi:hypothetical protein